MAKNLSVGIDIGTHQVKAVIAEEVLDGDRHIPKVLGTGTSETRGLRKGFIIDTGEVSKSVRIALDKAEKASGITVKRAFVSVGGVGLGSAVSTGTVAISRADLEVTNLDIEKAHDAAEASIPQSLSLNRKVINTIPLVTLLDGRQALGRVEGMRAGKLEVKILFITCLEHHLEDLIRSVEGAGVEVIDVVAAPIASSFVTLSKKQKMAGCLLLNIGAETTSMVVFENSNPISLEVFEMGGTDLTNDIALGLKTTLEEAENIKLGAYTRTDYPKKKMDDIISSRLSEIFELVEAHLKKIGRHQLLPAGAVLTGGGAGVYGIREFAEYALKLPARVGEIHFGNSELRSNKDLAWSVAYGLAVVGFNAENEQGSVGQKGLESIAEGSRRGLRQLSHWIGKFLP
ncbi:cell division protein FtsA [Candidatus Parcubacteria bacterium]|nr:cell division protein FtsA [Candidatus Parcubacteria bacterium]